MVLVGLLLVGEIAWGWHRTPWMYAGEPQRERSPRQAAAAWLAATSRPEDVLFGYEPLYLDAFEEGAPFGDVIVQRADPGLALETLAEAPKPLGRGVWVFDATDQLDTAKRLTIENASPGRSSSRGPSGRSSSSGRARRRGRGDVPPATRPSSSTREGSSGIGDAGLNHQTAIPRARAALREARA